MKTCSDCKTNNPEDSKYCRKCGIELKATKNKPTWLLLIIPIIIITILLAIIINDKSTNNDNKVEGSSISTDYSYPQASGRLLSHQELNRMSADELAVMRNEIYARHGYIFKNPKWKDYFSQKSWYTPKYDEVEDKLSPLEKNNVLLIKKYEKNF